MAKVVQGRYERICLKLKTASHDDERIVVIAEGL